jgi:restriction system protein
MSRLLDEPLNLSPEQFEAEVENLVRRIGIGLPEFTVQRLEKIQGSDGIYEIDVTARFEALGASFLVLIECKHHKSPIKREVVQVLYDRLRAIGGHKGMIFSTVKFQKGAIEFAQAHNIALVQVANGNTSYHTKSFGAPAQLPPWVPPYVGWVISLSENGNESYRLMSDSDPDMLLERFRAIST